MSVYSIRLEFTFRCLDLHQWASSVVHAKLQHPEDYPVIPRISNEPEKLILRYAFELNQWVSWITIRMFKLSDKSCDDKS